MSNHFEITEKELELVVREKTLGNLTTNAYQIKELVIAGLQQYDVATFDENNIESAKKAKALLNNAAKTLNTRRLEIEREFMQPFAEFKEVVAETVKLISQCSANIDIVVKLGEAKERENKRKIISAHWESKGFTLIGFDKIFDAKWLNKTVKLKDIYLEIEEKITKIEDDIKTLEAIDEDVELLKSLYLDTLNINNTIQYANTLKQNREKAQKAKMEAQSNKGNIKEAEIPFYNSDPNPTPSPAPPVETSVPILLTRAFKVTTTREKIIALGNFMNEQGIDFDKIEL
jgi:Protein of unknown function (DUF1351).